MKPKFLWKMLRNNVNTRAVHQVLDYGASALATAGKTTPERETDVKTNYIRTNKKNMPIAVREAATSNIAT